MADEEDEQEEESNGDIPGIPDDTSSQIILKSPSENAEDQSLSTEVSVNGKPPSVLSQGSRRSSQRYSPSVESNGVQEAAEEMLSRSQEDLKSPQDISLGSKKSSLEQLSKEKVPRAKVTRTYRQCNRRFKEIIGKRELKNEELEKHQSILKQRLNILECSMPAVMVWNIWRMTQSPCVPNLQRVLQKQFQGPASGELCCPSTPSRHFDCRVREVEAERKQARKRMDEAKTLWAEKMATLEDRHMKLEEAKKIQEETRERIRMLTVEVQKLREAATKAAEDGACETGECGVIECKKKWLQKVPSCTSIKSADIECLEKLEQLAENEVCMKRQIADLESREEAYMRTLQQADDLWCKVESDAARTMSGLQDQLNTKNVANQQLANRICELEDVIEELRARLTTCRGELEKYMSVSKIEALIGKDDDFADVLDKDVFAGVDMIDRMIGRVDDVAGVGDVGILAKDEMRERDMLAVAERADVDSEMRPEMADADWGVRPDSTEAGLVARPDLADVTVGVYRADLVGVDDAQLGIHPDDFAYEDERLREARKYLERIGSLSELDKYGDDYICDPDFVCNDVVFSETGLTEEEMTALRENRVTPQMLLEKYGVELDLVAPVGDEAERVAVAPETMLRTIQLDKEATKELETAELDVAKVEPTERVVEESDTVGEVKTVEDIKPIEETAPIQESEPAARIEPTEQVMPDEDEKHVEEIPPKEEPTVTEETEPMIEIHPVEEISPIEEIRPVEEIKPVEEVAPVEETQPAEQIKLAEDTKPTPEAHTPEPVIAIGEEAIVEKAEVKPLPTHPEEEMDKENVLVPRNEILSWQDDVDSIRTMIAKCVDCVVVKPDADKLAAMMAAHTGTEVKEIIETARPRDEVALKRPEDRLPAEIEVQAKPEAKTVEVSAMEGEPKVEVEIMADLPLPEAVVKEEIEPDYPPKPPTTPLLPETSVVQDDSAVPEVVVPLEEPVPGVIREPAKEAVEETAKIPTITKVEETEIPGVEEPRPGVTEVQEKEKPPATDVKKETSPEEIEMTVEMVPEEETKQEEPVVPAEKEVSPVVEVKIEALDEEETEVIVKEEVKRVPKEEKEEAVEEGEKVEKELHPRIDDIKEEPVKEEIKVEVLPEAEEVEEEPAEKVFKVELLAGTEEIGKEPAEEVVEGRLLVEAEEIGKEPVEELVKEELIPEAEIVEKEPVKVELLPKVEKVEREPVKEIEIKLLAEEEKDAKEVAEVKEEEEIVVPLDIIDETEVKVPEKEIDLAVKVLPAEKVPTVPKIEKKREPVVEEVLIEEPKKPTRKEPELMPEEEEEIVIPCTCLPMPPPSKRIEVTQTEVTRIETVQVITQTVVDVETQTTPRIARQVQPQVVTVTKVIDPDSETMERLLTYRKPLKDQVATMTVAESTHTLHSTSLHMRSTAMDRYPAAYAAASPHVPPDARGFTTPHAYPPSHPLSGVLRSLRMEGVHVKSDPEKELRSIYYGKRSGQVEEGKCNCCQCGRTISSPLQDSRTEAERPQIIPTYKIVSALPVSKRFGSPTDQTTQHEAFCPECKLRKLREVLKAQDPLKRVVKKPTRDQEVCTCIVEPGKGLPCQRIKRVSDQSCMAKIPKSKPDRMPKRTEDEYQEPVHCVCSGLIEAGKSGVLKKVHCACGDPD